MFCRSSGDRTRCGDTRGGMGFLSMFHALIARNNASTPIPAAAIPTYFATCTRNSFPPGDHWGLEEPMVFQSRHYLYNPHAPVPQAELLFGSLFELLLLHPRNLYPLPQVKMNQLMH